VNHLRVKAEIGEAVPILQQDVGCDWFWSKTQLYQWQQKPHQLAPTSCQAKPRLPSRHRFCIGAVDGDGSTCQPSERGCAAVVVEVGVGDEDQLEEAAAVACSQCLQVSQNDSLLVRRSGVYEHRPGVSFEQVCLR